MGKRGRGEGTIYRHKASGRWCAELRLGFGPDGKARRFRAYAETRREAAELLRRAQDDRDRGLPVVSANQTVAQFLEQWLEEVVKPLRRPHTYRGYEVNVRVHIVPALGHHRLGKLSPQHVQAWINELRDSGASPRTVEYARATLRRALNQALRWGLIGRNAATLVEVPTAEAPERPAVTPEQARAILAAVAPHRLGYLVTTVLGLALRQEEALGLRWEDVDLEKGFVQIAVALQRHEGEWQLLPLKTPKSRRRLPLPGFVVEALRAQRAMQEAENARLGPRWPGWPLVFTSRAGTPLDGPNVTHQLQRILAANDLPRLRFHDLRHATGTLLAALGVDIRTIMAILGHSQVSTTAEIYLHVTDPMAEEAMRRLDGAIRPPD